MPNQGQEKIKIRLIEELGLANLPQDKQEELMLKMTEVVLKRIFVETMEKLSDQDKQAYMDMIESDASQEEVENFINGKISNYANMVMQITEQFIEEMKKSA